MASSKWRKLRNGLIEKSKDELYFILKQMEIEAQTKKVDPRETEHRIATIKAIMNFKTR